MDTAQIVEYVKQLRAIADALEAFEFALPTDASPDHFTKADADKVIEAVKNLVPPVVEE